ncbi:hypothetical protein PP707_06325 [Acetobacter pasteurianus]|nr:hypothetical protein [Acetobacter pasteurianus]
MAPNFNSQPTTNNQQPAITKEKKGKNQSVEINNQFYKENH